MFFVTRPKAQMSIRVLEARPVPERSDVIHDEIIELTSTHAQRVCPYRLRRVVIVRQDTHGIMEILTNNFDLAASTIAAFYRDRW